MTTSTITPEIAARIMREHPVIVDRNDPILRATTYGEPGDPFVKLVDLYVYDELGRPKVQRQVYARVVPLPEHITIAFAPSSKNDDTR